MGDERELLFGWLVAGERRALQSACREVQMCVRPFRLQVGVAVSTQVMLFLLRSVGGIICITSHGAVISKKEHSCNNNHRFIGVFLPEEFSGTVLRDAIAIFDQAVVCEHNNIIHVKWSHFR